MAEMLAASGAPADAESQEGETNPQSRLQPIDFSRYDYVPGRYAPWYCSPDPPYGPDELGEYQNAIEEMIQNVNKADAAARIWEVLQAWEMRLFRRNYHFLTAGWKGWGMFGGSSGTTGASIMQTQNAMKLFSCNVFGSRCQKIVSLLSRQVPGVQIVAEDERDSIDQEAAEEGEKFLKVFEHQAGLKEVMGKAASYFFTDGRVGFLTYTIADATRWGMELPDRALNAYGAPEPSGITPETEMDGSVGGEETPARREVTYAFGKLETKVPLMADYEWQMKNRRFQWEESVNVLKCMYPWVRDKIATQGNVGGMDQIDRMARINVRLAVQASSSSGEAYKNDATHTVTFLDPGDYEGIKDDATRQVFYEEFPDGLEVWHAGGQLAMVRNCRATKHVKIVHAYPGDGQNREAIGTNYLPLQKVLNANISLIDRYFRGAVARRFAREPYIDTQALNTQSNDPAKITPVYIPEGSPLRIADVTGVESVPNPNNAIFEFVQWLIQGAPEAMDGGSPEVFGLADNAADEGVYKTARLRRDEARGVFALPWSALCEAMCAISLQAIESAGENRVANISASLPGEKKLEVEIAKLQGSVLVHPESLELPRTLAEEEEQMAELIEASSNVALYQAIVNDPRNLSVFSKFPSLRGLDLPGADDVEDQQGEFELLMKSGPVENPQLAQIQEQIAQAQSDPEAMTPQGQEMLAQLQQAMQSLPPLVSTVPVAQSNKENHVIHAAITLGFLKSALGRKLKYGTDEQKAIYQNFELHWQEHEAMVQKLAPPKEIEFKGSVTVDPSKFPPDAQARMFEAMGVQVPPATLQPEEMTHEITEERTGVDGAGTPVKQKISVVGKPLK